MLVFAQVRHGTRLIRSSALGMITLAIGFLGSAVGPLLPFWVTVIGMNVTLLAGGLWFHSGIRAFVTQQMPKPDWTGWACLACAMPLFIYWGLVEPNGVYRSVVFSFTAGLIHIRTAWLLISYSRKSTFKTTVSFLTLTFSVFSIWMLMRGGILLFSEFPPLETKKINPTSWQTVFAFNILISLLTASLLVIELQKTKENSYKKDSQQTIQDNLLLLYGVVAVTLLAILCETGIVYLALNQHEPSQIQEQNSPTLPENKHHEQLISETNFVLQAILLGALLAIAVVVAMGFILASSMKRRDEQDRFLSMISHELRTPMSVIRMVSGSPAIPEHVRDRIVRAVNNMNGIIDSALQADRLEHGLVQATIIAFDLDGLLHTIQEDCADPTRIHIESPSGLICQTDPQWLKVIVGNLLDNALKYSPANSDVNINIQCTSHQKKPGYCITISNFTGSAKMPDADQIFHKYYRGTNASGKTGSGLGLHIADGLARLIGGYLKYSHDTYKVQFSLWIPL